MDKKKIRKAVFPVAGLGTRFLPATKASPKEMLPIVDKPLIQYAAEEVIAAGIEQLIFVTSSSKRAIEDHFDKNQELEDELSRRGKDQYLDMIRHIVPPAVSCIYIRQPEALGLGHAVLCAKPVVGDEPFAVILADDLIDGKDRPCLLQMVEQYQEHQYSIIAVEEVDPNETSQYGIIKADRMNECLFRLSSIVEKPEPADAPSNLGVVGRYLLNPTIFKHLEEIEHGAGGELQLTDAIASLLIEESVLGYQFEGMRYDCGSKLGYLTATINYALQHVELAEEFRDFLRKCCREHI